MYKSTVASLGVVGTASAQESVLNLFLLGFMSQSIVGSVKHSLAGACSRSGAADIAGSTTTISDILTNFMDGGAVLDGRHNRNKIGVYTGIGIEIVDGQDYKDFVVLESNGSYRG
ncbi:hypothetical protein F5882DRAFT_438496 [Hyaloscypha sp. PMI_1271]|nr:hypothetical protein F5882DRAFT_438496 [Hyaloscypha sp. PMI_1271]